jgi:hypothetical protein
MDLTMDNKKLQIIIIPKFNLGYTNPRVILGNFPSSSNAVLSVQDKTIHRPTSLSSVSRIYYCEYMQTNVII